MKFKFNWYKTVMYYNDFYTIISEWFSTKDNNSNKFYQSVPIWGEIHHKFETTLNILLKVNISNYVEHLIRAGKIRFSGTRKSVLLKASSGERCAPRNFVHLATLEGTRVLPIVYLAVHHMKYIMER